MLFLFLSSFVLADSSIVANFVVGDSDDVPDYVPSSSIWDGSLVYIILIVLGLVVVYIALKHKKVSKVRKVKVVKTKKAKVVKTKKKVVQKKNRKMKKK